MKAYIVLSEGEALRHASRVGLAVLCLADVTAELEATLSSLAAHRDEVPVYVVGLQSSVALREHFQLPPAPEPVLVFVRRGAEVGRLVGARALTRAKLALDCALEAPPGAEAMRADAILDSY